MSAATEDLIRDRQVLADLPVGSVVLARHRRYGDTWAWSKSDDTQLVDEYGDSRPTAWACVAYTADRTDADLLMESDAVRLLWHGDDGIEVPA